MQQVFDRLYGIRQAAQGLNVADLRTGLGDVTTEVEGLQALLADGAAFDTQVAALRTKAQEELARKAASAGIQPSGVPVIDVGGVLLQGLDETTLKNVLAQKGFLSAR